MSFFLSVVLPRTLSLALLPETYQMIGFSAIFDGSATVILQVLALVSMRLGGSYKREILWPRRRQKRFRRFLTLVIFIVNPGAWLVREYFILHDMAAIASAVEEDLGPARPGKSFMREPYDVQAHISNKYGGMLPIQPDIILTYKTVLKHEVGCDFHHTPLAIPGDVAFTPLLMELRKGNLQLDVYKPFVKRFEEAPIILHIHGGGWRRGHRRFISFNYHGGIPRYLLSHGYMIVSVSYRLICPPVTGHKQIEDVLDATQYVIKHAKQWGGDPNKIMSLGTSAGGHLAMLLAYKYNLPQIKGVFNFYGVSELRTKEMSRQVTGMWETMHSQVFAFAVKKICEDNEDMEFEECMGDLSPLNFVSKKSPPTITIHGWQDSLVSIQQAITLDKRLKENNVTHIPVFMQGEFKTFNYERREF